MARTVLVSGIGRFGTTPPGPPRREGWRVRPAVEELEARRTPSAGFAAQQTFAVGATPFAVAVADFNGDGRPDLAIAESASNSVSVLLDATPAGASTPSFTTQLTFAVGTEPLSVAVGDFNGDGRPDLVVANTSSGTVSVLLNTTPAGSFTPSFAAQRTFQVGTTPFSVAVGDFNGDGRPDLAVANFGSNTVSVLLNTTPAGASTPSFAAQQTFAVGTNPESVAVGDFNGDGRPDLAVASGEVSVLLDTTAAGASTPSFAPQQTFAVGVQPRSVAVGDFNGDGRPDLAVANENSGTVSVLLDTTAAGAATPSFVVNSTPIAVGVAPVAVAVGDLDGDGRPDLVVANSAANNVSVLLDTTAAGASDATFAAQQTFAVGVAPLGVAVGDFNGDGRPDLVTANDGSNSASVLLNTTSPFATAATMAVGQFGGAGVWEYNRALATWVQLTPANASRLAADSLGDVAGEFPGAGVWLFRPSGGGWKQINGVDASLLAMNAGGVLVAEFPGFGVGEFLPASGWRLLTGANASLLAVDALGDVAGEFPGFGVWLFRPAASWTQINGVDASLLAMDPLGDVVADFPGFGVGEFRPVGGWTTLNGIDAHALAVDRYGDVAAAFAGFGVGQFLPASGWRTLTGADASLLACDGLNDVLGEFPGHGVWEFDASRGWYQLTAADATVLVTG